MILNVVLHRNNVLEDFVLLWKRSTFSKNCLQFYKELNAKVTAVNHI